MNGMKAADGRPPAGPMRGAAKGGLGTSNPGMIGYTLAEIRRRLNSLAHARSSDPDGIWSWSGWADDAHTRPGSATTDDTATRS